MCNTHNKLVFFARHQYSQHILQHIQIIPLLTDPRGRGVGLRHSLSGQSLLALEWPATSYPPGGGGGCHRPTSGNYEFPLSQREKTLQKISSAPSAQGHFSCTVLPPSPGGGGPGAQSGQSLGPKWPVTRPRGGG